MESQPFKILVFYGAPNSTVWEDTSEMARELNELGRKYKPNIVASRERAVNSLGGLAELCAAVEGANPSCFVCVNGTFANSSERDGKTLVGNANVLSYSAGKDELKTYFSPKRRMFFGDATGFEDAVWAIPSEGGLFERLDDSFEKNSSFESVPGDCFQRYLPPFELKKGNAKFSEPWAKIYAPVCADVERPLPKDADLVIHPLIASVPYFEKIPGKTKLYVSPDYTGFSIGLNRTVFNFSVPEFANLDETDIKKTWGPLVERTYGTGNSSGSFWNGSDRFSDYGAIEIIAPTAALITLKNNPFAKG